MSDNQPEKTSGIVTSDSSAFEQSRSSKRRHRVWLWSITIIGFLSLVAFGAYWYSQNIRRTTAENAGQVIQKLENTLADGKVTEASGDVLPPYQPKGQPYFVKPEKAQTITYKVAPNKVEKTYKKARHILDRQGLTGKLISSKQAGATPGMYYDNEFVHCYLGAQTDEKNNALLQVACANTKAYLDAAKQLQVFYDLYAQNNPDKKAIVGITISSLKDSLTKGYKTAEIVVIQNYSPEGALQALYYQAPDGKWNYFKATVLEIFCEEYNTPDVQKAFIGKPCYDANMNFSSVKP